MSDELGVSTSGSATVATGELAARADALDSLSTELDTLAFLVVNADLLVTAEQLRAAGAPVSGWQAERAIDLAGSLLGSAGKLAGSLASSLRLAASAYSLGERVKERALEQLAAAVGYGIGVFFPIIVASNAVTVAAGAAAFVVASGGPDKAVANAQKWLREHNELITDPRFVALLHLASKSVDDVLAGLGRLPPELNWVISDEGLDVVGDDMTAAVIVVAGSGAGLFAEGPISVTKTGTTTIAASPEGLADRVSRIPKTDENGGSQIVVEKYVHPDGHVSWEVYFSGTQDFSASGTDTPFDMTSNMRAMAHLPAGSYAAAERALRESGVDPDDPIVFTGHSQGALLAHELAASGKYNVAGVVEVGGPVSGSTLPEGANGVAIVHTDDIVPALGVDRPVDKNEVVVERRAFHGDIPKDEAVPAHNRGKYEETAALADKSTKHELTTAKNGMDSASRGATIMTSTTFKASREKD